MTRALPRSVLAPVDFGEASAHAVALAGFIAQACEARLRLLHAESAEAPAYFTREQLDALERERQATRAQAEQFLSRFGHEHTPALFSPVVDDRPPVDAILVESETSDLVVMGTHGRRGPSRWWLGSVAERVSREADVPVLVVRTAAREDDPEHIFVRPMMIASPQALEGAADRYATGLAEAFGGQPTPNAARCEADLAREREASMMVVAKTKGLAARFAEPTERMLRTCSLPMLFVPGDR
jgi:nucleotide-binding universal stress UspA family protein